jgi:hypothetical protein
MSYGAPSLSREAGAVYFRFVGAITGVLKSGALRPTRRGWREENSSSEPALPPTSIGSVQSKVPSPDGCFSN